LRLSFERFDLKLVIQCCSSDKSVKIFYIASFSRDEEQSLVIVQTFVSLIRERFLYLAGS